MTLLVSNNAHVSDPSVSGGAQAASTCPFELFWDLCDNTEELLQGYGVCFRGSYLLQTVLFLLQHVLGAVFCHDSQLMVHLKDEIKADIDEEQCLALFHRERWVKFLNLN